MIKVPELHLATPQQQEGSYYYGVFIYDGYEFLLDAVCALDKKVNKQIGGWLLGKNEEGSLLAPKRQLLVACGEPRIYSRMPVVH